MSMYLFLTLEGGETWQQTEEQARESPMWESSPDPATRMVPGEKSALMLENPGRKEADP